MPRVPFKRARPIGSFYVGTCVLKTRVSFVVFVPWLEAEGVHYASRPRTCPKVLCLMVAEVVSYNFARVFVRISNI